ncbi:MAG: AAA family ATPase, partial [archaeon]|nr:AAA family ATPase [archaeon]
ILAATNRIDMIDPALLRPGRFDKCLFVGPPDADGLRQLWDLYASRRMPLHPDVDLALLIDRSGALSGAHVENICREAALLALRENIHSPHVALRHFLAAIEMAHSRLH